MDLVKAELEIPLCPTMPEESWRRTDPNIFFLVPEEVLNIKGEKLNDSKKNNISPKWEIEKSIINPKTIFESIPQSFQNLCDKDFIQNYIVPTLSSTVFITLQGNKVKVNLSEELFNSIDVANSIAHLSSILPSSDISESLAKRLQLVTSSNLEIIIKNTGLKIPNIFYLVENNPNQSYANVLFQIEKNCQANICAIDFESKFTMHRHTLALQQNAKVNTLWIEMSDTTVNMNTLEDINLFERKVYMSENALLNDAQLFIPGSQCRVISNIEFTGQGAVACSSSAIVVNESSKIDFEPVQHHIVPQCKSTLKTKILVSGNGQAVFQGLVKIIPEANKSTAMQANSNLLIGKKSQVIATPRLQIIPSDVICKHGSATGEIDVKQLYYLYTRGFSESQAKALITKGFVTDGLSALSDEEILKQFALNILNKYIDNM